ncbi:hypothetical protein IPL68_02025 [Candidatus Saccharibacteria bacterium]|nr:MAG: hypothetical protein IPL68_02025 [Candidatus Saccharibacteria bacterium]
MKSKYAWGCLSAVVITGVGVWLLLLRSEESKYAKPVGIVVTTPNAELSKSINIYLESLASQRTPGFNNYHCANTLYGYDEKYAYSWAYCQGYTDYSKGVNGTGEGYSSPVRLVYRKPNFVIISHQMPKDGSAYGESMRKLFPSSMYKALDSSKDQSAGLIQQVETAAAQSEAN